VESKTLYLFALLNCYLIVAVLMLNKFLFQLYGDSDDLKVSDVLEVLNSISKISNSGFENSSEEAKKVLEQESGSNLVNDLLSTIVRVTTCQLS